MFCNGMLLTQLTANMCHLSKSPAIDARDLNPWEAELQGHSFAGYPSRSFGHYTRMKCLYDLYGCCNSGCHCMCGSRQQGDQQLVGAHLLSSPAPIATHPAQIAKHPACIAILCCDETQHLPWTQQIQPEWGGLGRMFSSRLLAPANVREVWSDSNDPLHAWPAVNMQALAKASRIRVCIFAWHQQQAPARSWSFSRTPSSREMRRHIWKQLHIEMHRRPILPKDRAPAADMIEVLPSSQQRTPKGLPLTQPIGMESHDIVPPLWCFPGVDSKHPGYPSLPSHSALSAPRSFGESPASLPHAPVAPWHDCPAPGAATPRRLSTASAAAPPRNLCHAQPCLANTVVDELNTLSQNVCKQQKKHQTSNENQLKYMLCRTLGGHSCSQGLGPYSN